MITFMDLLSQWTLELTPKCNLKCGMCSLWDSGRVDGQGLLVSLHDGTFFSQFSKKRLINIVGGEPFENPDLSVVLTELKEQGLKIRLWSNGITQPDQWMSIKNTVDGIMIYLPTVFPEDYQLSTGFATWGDFEDSLRFLKKHRLPFSFHTPVSQANLSDLPDFYDYAQSYGVPLCLHYSAREALHPEHEKYILRFLRVKGVSVYKKKTAMPPTVCPALPHGAFEDPYQILKNAFFDQFK